MPFLRQESKQVDYSKGFRREIYSFFKARVRAMRPTWRNFGEFLFRKYVLQLVEWSTLKKSTGNSTYKIRLGRSRELGESGKTPRTLHSYAEHCRVAEAVIKTLALLSFRSIASRHRFYRSHTVHRCRHGSCLGSRLKSAPCRHGPHSTGRRMSGMPCNTLTNHRW